MNDMYSLLAPVYDRLNREVDHEAWADYYDREIKTHERGKTSLVLDLGCGTGSLTLAMDARGYDMTGLDGNPDMLTVARERAERSGCGDRMLFLCQDMTDFELYGTVEAVVSSLDCINHLLSSDEVKDCFALVHNYLSPDGLFLFDINSPYKFKTVYGDRSYLFEDKTGFCAWQNAYREKSGICDFSITLFTKEKNGTYRRHDAVSRERMYTVRQIKRWLREAGFELLTLAGGLDGHPMTSTDERIFITARAVKP